MTNKLWGFVCACIIAIGMMPTNQALAMAKDVVVDMNGNVVRDGSGGCVRTMWDVDQDKCKAMHMIMMMDERIIYFDFDKAMLKDEEKAKLDVLAAALKEHNIKAVKIVGYTDRIGTSEYNDKLSEKRAVEVKHYLDSKVHLDKSVVDLRALGEKDQVKACEGIKGKELISCLAPNRRVEVEVDYYDHMH